MNCISTWLLLFSLSANLSAQDLTEEEKAQIEESIDQEVAKADAAVTTAADALVKELREVIQGLDTETERDTEKELMAQLDAFRAQGILPTHPALEKARKRYIQALEEAQRIRNESLEKIVGNSLKRRDWSYWREARARVDELMAERLVPEEPEPDDEESESSPDAAARSPLATALPVGTSLSCKRTFKGGDHTTDGKVVENDGRQIVIETGSRSGEDRRLWTFEAEGRSLLLESNVGKNGRGGTMTSFEGRLKFTSRGIRGTYSWDLETEEGPKRVEGRLDWKVIPGALKDDQLELWVVGAKVEGERGADVHVQIDGDVTVSDRDRLVISARETWRKSGRTFSPHGTWVFERVSVDPETGKVKFRFVDCERPRGGNPIFNEAGDLELSGSVLTGDYQYDWKDKKDKSGEVHTATGRLRFNIRK